MFGLPLSVEGGVFARIGTGWISTGTIGREFGSPTDGSGLAWADSVVILILDAHTSLE